MSDRERCPMCGSTRTRIDEHMVVRCCECGRDIYDNPATSGYAAPSELRVTSVSMGGAAPDQRRDSLPARDELEELFQEVQFAQDDERLTWGKSHSGRKMGEERLAAAVAAKDAALDRLFNAVTPDGSERKLEQQGRNHLNEGVNA